MLLKGLIDCKDKHSEEVFHHKNKYSKAVFSLHKRTKNTKAVPVKYQGQGLEDSLHYTSEGYKVQYSKTNSPLLIKKTTRPCTRAHFPPHIKRTTRPIIT